jgi:hypothetical protein
VGREVQSVVAGNCWPGQETPFAAAARSQADLGIQFAEAVESPGDVELGIQIAVPAHSQAVAAGTAGFVEEFVVAAVVETVDFVEIEG